MMSTTSDMRILWLWVILVLDLTLVVAAQSENARRDIRQPPSMISSFPRTVIFKPAVEMRLVCEAYGYPEPAYRWEKDGEIPETTLGVKMRKGVLTIEGYFSHAGRYRCFASNQWGVALTDFIDVRMATLSRPKDTDVVDVQVFEGDPLTLSCGVVSVPAASFSWWTNSDVHDDDVQEVEPSPRIVLDEDGNLHYSYVISSDAKNGDVYRCRALNTPLDRLLAASYYRIEVEERIAEHTAPKPLHSSLQRANDSYITAFIGHILTLKCAFAAYPQVTYSWHFNGAPTTQYQMLDSNSTIQISDIRRQDEGTYTCVGVNSAGKGIIDIPVKVFEIPTFKNPDEKPHDTVGIEGEDVDFYCRATGQPTPEVQWFTNGDPLPDPEPGSMFTFGDDNTHLIIRDVCKRCGEQGDLKTIQCNSSNEYGYAFAGGFLNVLLPTVITVAPENVTLQHFGGLAEFTCEATTDDITRDDLSLAWKFEGEYIRPLLQDEVSETIWTTRDKVVRLINGGKVLILNTTILEIWDYEGVYTCVASTRYSRDEKHATLTLPRPNILLSLDISTGMPTGPRSSGKIYHCRFSLLIIHFIVIYACSH